VSGKGLALGLGRGERGPFDFERPPDDLDGLLQPGVRGPGLKEALPEEAVALIRVLMVVPAPEFLDRHVAILGYPVNQRLGRPEGVSELLPQEHDICDWWPARTR
jgi:hypothetical protein